MPLASCWNRAGHEEHRLPGDRLADHHPPIRHEEAASEAGSQAEALVSPVAGNAPWFGADSVPDWFSPNLYAPDLGMPTTAPAPAKGGAKSSVSGAQPAPAPLDQAAAVGSGTGNGALGQALGAAPVDPGAVANALQGIDPNSPGGGVSGIGYNGQVNSLGDFAKAIASGAGVVFGGLPGMIGLGLGATNGFKNGAGLTQNLLAMLGLTGGSTPGVLGNIMDSTTGGALGSKDMEIGSSLGDSVGSSGSQGDAANAAAERRGMARGGALSIAIRGGRR